MENVPKENEGWCKDSQERFAKILRKYFDQVLEKNQKNFALALEEIIQTGRELKQFPPQTPNSFKAEYHGELRIVFDGENAQNAIPEHGTKSQSLEWIKEKFMDQKAELQVFHNDADLFAHTREWQFLDANTKLKDLHNLHFSGSLDTYVEKDSENGLELLRQLSRFAERLVERDDDLSIADRTYLIWKTAGYSTPDHQDAHQAQHLVSYHQLRGTAFFHILPPICGLFLAHLYIVKDVEKIAQTLTFYDERSIGHYTYLKAGEVIFLPPDKTHFVQVPYNERKKNVDFVRAFEILFDYEAMKKRKKIAEETVEIENITKRKREEAESKREKLKKAEMERRKFQKLHKQYTSSTDEKQLQDLIDFDQYLETQYARRSAKKISFENKVNDNRAKKGKRGVAAKKAIYRKTRAEIIGRVPRYKITNRFNYVSDLNTDVSELETESEPEMEKANE
jgi:hypothetical protein